MSGGDPAAARWFYEYGLKIRRRLADAAPENADYARGLWVSYWKMAALAEKVLVSRRGTDLVARRSTTCYRA